jgi:type II secretory pathway pseudopilin PulG
LSSLTLLGLQGGRQSARDTRRKADVEEIRQGLELYKADCKTYPTADIFALSPATLKGNMPSTLSACNGNNVYIKTIPKDPLQSPDFAYKFFSNGSTYEICARLEGSTGNTVTCGTTSTCGAGPCNYKAINP